MKRLGWADSAKAFAMLLVVYGHSLATGWGSDKWIYSFHIPLFFLVSGALLRVERLNVPWRAFLAETVAALAPAYFTFAAIGLVAWLFVLRRFGADAEAPISPLQRLLAIFYGTGKPAGFRLEPTALWFFPCLFSARLIVYWVYRLADGSGARALSITMALSVVGLVIPSRIALPLELDAALVAQGFLVAGFELRRHNIVERIGSSSPVLILALLGLGAVCAYSNIQVDMRASKYGNVVLYYASALATSVGVLAVFSKRSPSRIEKTVARNTVIIFPLHILVFSIFAAVYVFVLRLPLSVRENPMVGILASLANVAVLVLVAPLVQRLLPWVYGGRTSGPPLAPLVSAPAVLDGPAKVP
jgi:fucose 4-O-acetylase-like acetyltransferase